MKIRTKAIAGMTMLIALLVMFASCDISIFIWEPEPDPDPVGLEFTLSWQDDGTADPHLYVTYPAGDTTDGTLITPTFTEPYLPPTDGGDLGFDPIDQGAGIPNELTDVRGAVYYSDTASTLTFGGDPAVEMTDNSDESESIIVRAFPFTSTSSEESTTGGGITLLDPGSYAWVGVMEVYGYSTSGGQLANADGTGVDAVLSVTNDGEPFAQYVLPTTTDLQGAQVIRINCFYQIDGFTLYEVYQLVPDVRIINSTTQIRSVAPGADVSDSGVVTIKRAVTL